MKNIYINTRYTYVLGCIPAIIGSVPCYLGYLRDSTLKTISLLSAVIYCILFGYCVWETGMQRKLQDTVVANGRCIAGTVKGLKKVYFESSIGRVSNNVRSAYRIQAEVVDEFGVPKTYYSDLIPKSKKKYIPPIVKIYCYMDRNCMVWEKEVYQIKYPVTESREMVKGNQGRLWLIFFNHLAWMVLGGCLIGILYDYVIIK